MNEIPMLWADIATNTPASQLTGLDHIMWLKTSRHCHNPYNPTGPGLNADRDTHTATAWAVRSALKQELADTP